MTIQITEIPSLVEDLQRYADLVGDEGRVAHEVCFLEEGVDLQDLSEAPVVEEIFDDLINELQERLGEIQDALEAVQDMQAPVTRMLSRTGTASMEDFHSSFESLVDEIGMDRTDVIAMREAYNNYLDGLNKDGEISDYEIFYAENPY